MRGAHRGIKAVHIKIEALGTGVIKDAVQNHPNAHLSGFGTESAEILLRTQHGVDFGVVRRVVAVVGGGLENRAEIKRCYAQVRQVGEAGGNTGQRTAEKSRFRTSPSESGRHSGVSAQFS